MRSLSKGSTLRPSSVIRARRWGIDRHKGCAAQGRGCGPGPRARSTRPLSRMKARLILGLPGCRARQARGLLRRQLHRGVFEVRRTGAGEAPRAYDLVGVDLMDGAGSQAHGSDPRGHYRQGQRARQCACLLMGAEFRPRQMQLRPSLQVHPRSPPPPPPMAGYPAVLLLPNRQAAKHVCCRRLQLKGEPGQRTGDNEDCSRTGA